MDSLTPAREQAGGPLTRRNRLVLSAFTEGSQHDKSGQIFRFGAEAVNHPCAHTGPARNLRTGVHEHVRRIMIDRFSGHRANQTDFLNDRADLRKQLTNLDLIFYEFFKFMLRSETTQ